MESSLKYGTGIIQILLGYALGEEKNLQNLSFFIQTFSVLVVFAPYLMWVSAGLLSTWSQMAALRSCAATSTAAMIGDS